MKRLFKRISLALLLSFSLVMAVPVAANGITYYVNDSTGADSHTVVEAQSADTPWLTIQHAVDTVGAGDTINVAAGEYVENVDVEEQVTIIGAGAANTIVTAADSGDHVFTVEKDNVTISGFTVTGATEEKNAGIYLDKAGSCDISANTCLNNYDGIYLDESINNTLTGNIADSNTRDGIYLDGSSNNTLTDNTADSNTRYGIYLDSSSDNTLTGNTANSNTEYGIYLDSSSNNTLTSNTADSNTEYGIYLDNSSGNTLTSNTANSNTEYGIYLANSDSNTLTENTANLNTKHGIYLNNGSINNTLSQNTVSENGEHGIYLDSSSDNTLTENTANLNTKHGIYLNNGSINNTLTSNTANSNTEYGIYLDSSSDNTLTSNTANSNTEHGIYLNQSGSNNLTGNAMSGNSYNFHVVGSSVSHYVQVINTTNTVDGKPVYYLVGADGNVIGASTNAGYVGVVNSTNVTVKDLTLTKGGQGVLFAYTSHSSIENVTVSDNYYGIYLDGSVDASTISINFNNIYGNTNYGVDNTGGTSDVDAENNWWGAKDGPGGVGRGTGDAVSDNVDYDPWLGVSVEDSKTETTAAGNQTVDAKAEADTEVDKSGNGTPTVTIASYTSNPHGSAPGGFQAAGNYIDAHLNDTTNVDEIVTRKYYTAADFSGLVESSLRIYYWDGTDWTQCSDTGVDMTDIAGPPAYSGYIWAKIRADTTPGLDYLLGSSLVPMGSIVPPPPAVVEGRVIPARFLRIDMLGTTSRVEITNDGIIAEACTVISLEGELALEVDGGTRVICSNNQLPVLLEARPSEELPPATEGIVIVSPIYDFIAYTRGGVSQPVTFDPPARLVINYAPEAVPENTSSLSIGYYNEEQGWTQLEPLSGFVAEVGTAGAQVSHFTPFAVLAELASLPLPARFELHNLDINPIQVTAGESVTISAQLVNIGGLSGNHTLVINIERLLQTSRVIQLTPGQSQEISLSITPDKPGSYRVEIDDLRGNFVVRAIPTPPIPTPPIPTPPAPTPAAEAGGYGWLLIPVIFAGAVITALALIVRRKRLQRAAVAVVGEPSKPAPSAFRAAAVGKPSKPAPGDFRISTLKITPRRVKPGGSVTIISEAANTGLVTGSYSLVLKIKGMVEAVKEITLAPGQSQKVAFTILKDEPGVYDVDVEGLKGSFTVEEVAAPPDSPLSERK